MKKTDIIASLIIGEAAAWLMIWIDRSINLQTTVLAPIAPYIGDLPWIFPLFTLGVMIAGAYLGRRIAIAYQFSKFLLVGGLNFVIDLGVLNLMIFLTDITGGFYILTFKALASITAVTSSFIWNKFWTFQSLSTEQAALQFFEFLAVSAVGFGINVGAFALMNNWIGPQAGIDPKTWANASAAAAAVAGLLWNFAGYKFIVFRRPKA